MRVPLIAVVVATLHSLTCAQTPPPGFTYQMITDNDLVKAGAMAFAPDGRLFICERTTGNVRVLQDGILWPTPWASVPCALNHTGDHGLMGIAVDPGFLTNGYVYVYYTTADALQNRIARFQDVGGFGANFTILSPNGAIPTGNYPNHNGGKMVFGRDGTLFVGTGDRTDPTVPQSMASWCGKILRFEVPNLTIPANNPTPGSPIYSRGHRSQYGIAIRPSNGDLFQTEVGNTAMDEINRIVAGGNYGWPIHEGTEITPDPQTVDPIAVYNPTPEPTGLCFYSGTLYPAGYAGAMFFVEFSEGRVRKCNLNAAGTAITSEIVFDDLGQAFDIQMGPDGHLWVLHNDTPGQRGGDEIGRYVYTGEPVPGIQMMAVSNRVIGGSITFGMRGNLGDIMLAWVSLSALPVSVPTPFGPMWVAPDLVQPIAIVLGDDHGYITLPIPNNPAFSGYTLFGQGASVGPTGVITTTANFDSVPLR